MTKRAKLPNRRLHDSFAFEHWGMQYVVGLGKAQPGEFPKEIFLNCGKSGTQSEILARDSAILLSIALQYGVPLDSMKHAITRDMDGTPSGPIGKLLDLLYKETT